MADEGYFALQLENVTLKLNAPVAADAKWRIDVEILNAYDVFQWVATKETKFTTGKFSPVAQDDSSVYVYSFDSQYLQSNYVELTPEALNGLCNAVVSIKVLTINEAAASAPPPKAVKGQPPPPTVAPEEVLIEYSLPLATILTVQGNSLYVELSVAEYQSQDLGLNVAVVHPSVAPENSYLNLKFFADSCLSEYALDCRLVYWQSAELSSAPAPWTLHYADVLDPKAKVPPTAADLRAKYLENIVKLVESQGKVASYTLQVGSAESVLNWAFGVMQLSAGKAVFDQATASTVAADEEVRNRIDLWTLSWQRSPFIFLHRSSARKLAKQVADDPQAAYLPLTLRKTPTAEFMAAEGGEVMATALLDISPLFAPGRSSQGLEASGFTGDQMDATNPALAVVLASSQPIVPLPQISQLNTTPALRAAAVGAVPPPRGLRAAKNKDAAQELRDEIARVLERIAQEYVSSYPAPVPVAVPSAPDGAGTEKEDERRRFLLYLANNGLFHDLQERLRPAVVLMLQEKYGPRGRALGRSEALRGVDTQGEALPAEHWEAEGMKAVLAEAYTFLCKECNIVLNSIFSKTMLQRSKLQLENPGRPDDETESPAQTMSRLLRQAQDAAADGRHSAADELHLERLSLLDEVEVLRTSAACVHDAYVAYAEFLLRQAAQGISQHRITRSACGALQQRARDCLRVAAAQQPENWSTLLLFACVVIEGDQAAVGEDLLHRVIAIQLERAGRRTYSMSSFDAEFSGYETDELAPVHPRVYAVLAAVFQVRGKALLARKALLLANRCYSEWEEAEDAGALGTPRRSLVLLLAQTCQYLLQHSLFQVAQGCLSLALESEAAVQQKAKLKGKPALCPAFIKHALKRAQVEASWGFFPMLTESEVVQVAEDCALIADRPADKVAGRVVAAQAALRVGDLDQALDHFLLAVKLTGDHFSAQEARQRTVLPLDAVLTTGRLLQQCGRNEEAVQVLLFASTLFSSAALALQLGVNLMRLERFDEAEAALIEANLLDNRLADTWAMLSMLCVQRGPPRLLEAEQCLFQTLRLGLVNAVLLRELAMAFMSIDKLTTAEDLIRRAMAAEASVSPKNASNPHTRKLLADVLAGQNLAAKAVDEYKAVLLDSGADKQTKLSVADKCLALLASLGRDDELLAVKNVIWALESAENQQPQVEEQ